MSIKLKKALDLYSFRVYNLLRFRKYIFLEDVASLCGIENNSLKRRVPTQYLQDDSIVRAIKEENSWEEIADTLQTNKQRLQKKIKNSLGISHTLLQILLQHPDLYWKGTDFLYFCIENIHKDSTEKEMARYLQMSTALFRDQVFSETRVMWGALKALTIARETKHLFYI